MLIDSHCHLDFEDFEAEGASAVAARAAEAGVGRMLTICCEVAKFPAVAAAADQSPLVDCSIGTHPHHAAKPAEAALSVADLVAATKRHPKIVAIGETGLDYYYNHAPQDIQQRVFSNHIRAAVETGLPLVIHTRDAEEDTMRLLRVEGGGSARGVMHCFSGSAWLAAQALDIGFYISFSGILTFKKAEDLRAIAATVPADRLLVETDSPYLAPVPYRGKRNEPAYVTETAKVLAEIKGMTLDALAAQTTENYFTLFNKAKR